MPCLTIPYPPSPSLHTSKTADILQSREDEEVNAALSVSIYDIMRNEPARQHKKEVKQKQLEDERIRKEKEMDFLAPFLARIGDPPQLSKEQMVEVSQVWIGSSPCNKHVHTLLSYTYMCIHKQIIWCSPPPPPKKKPIEETDPKIP